MHNWAKKFATQLERTDLSIFASRTFQRELLDWEEGEYFFSKLYKFQKLKGDTPLWVSRWLYSWWQPRSHWFVYLEREKSIKKFGYRFLDSRWLKSWWRFSRLFFYRNQSYTPSSIVLKFVIQLFQNLESR